MAFAFLGYFAFQSRNQFVTLYGDAQFEWLILSVFFWASLHFISPVFTTTILRSCNLALSYRDAFLIHSRRLPAKYIPGGIWHTIARVTDYHNKGISTRQIGHYVLVENIVTAAVTFLVGGYITSQLQFINDKWQIIAGFLSFTGAFVLVLLPWLTNRKLLISKEVMNIKIYFLGILVAAFFWIVAACSFVSFLTIFPDRFLSLSFVESGGIYIFSWGIGFVALFAPQGIGVTELVTSQLFGSEMGISSMAALLASFRLVIFVGDLTGWGISRLLKS